MLFIREKGFYCHTGSILLGFLFAATAALPHRLTIERNFNLEALIMVRTGLTNQRIGQYLVLLTLNQLLQLGLIVDIMQLLHRYMA